MDMEHIFLSFPGFRKLKISPHSAWIIDMKNKYGEVLIFIAYTWLIINSYYFIGAPIIIYSFGFKQFLEASLFFFPFLILFFLEVPIFSLDTLFFIGRAILILLGFAFVYFIPVHSWWCRQTLLKAFFLSLTGLIIGPGSVFFWTFIGKNMPKTGLLILPLICFFYRFLYEINELQKKFFPDNKFCNAIRFALKWPCLRA